MKNKMKSNIKFEQNIDKLLKILVCPKTGGKLRYDKKRKELICGYQSNEYDSIFS